MLAKIREMSFKCVKWKFSRCVKLTSAKANAENGVSAGGWIDVSPVLIRHNSPGELTLITTVHPAAKAGPTLRVIMADARKTILEMTLK